jgi:hypothetical protein
MPTRSLFGRAKDRFPRVLAAVGTPLPDFAHSGYVLAYVMAFLIEHRIAPPASMHAAIARSIGSKRGITAYILANEDRDRFLDAYDRSLLSGLPTRGVL